MKVIFFGTPHFAAEVLSYLLDNGIDIVAVVTKPDKPQGRSAALVPTPVKVVAESRGLPVFQPEIVSATEYAPILEAFHADLFVVVAYGEIIKQHLLDMPKKACINLHASLLPHYRGAAPIQRAIINGEKKTGVTIIHMVKKMDAGDMVAMQTVDIGSEMTYGELEQELCRIGSQLLLSTICQSEHSPLPRIPQDDSQVTFAPKITIEECQINWNLPADQIHNLVRGVNPHPGAWCPVLAKGQNKRLRVISTSVASMDATSQPPGHIVSTSKNSFQVSCGLGILNLLEVQLEGKKAMAAGEFMRGHPPGTLEMVFV